MSLVEDRKCVQFKNSHQVWFKQSQDCYGKLTFCVPKPDTSVTIKRILSSFQDSLLRISEGLIFGLNLTIEEARHLLPPLPIDTQSPSGSFCVWAVFHFPFLCCARGSGHVIPPHPCLSAARMSHWATGSRLGRLCPPTLPSASAHRWAR